MFENLTSRLSNAFQNIIGKKFTEENIKDTLKEIKKALLEADVALEVVEDFSAELKKEVIGLEVSKELSHAQELVKIVDRKLTELMGSTNSELELNVSSPVIILMAGLQGAGKTTATAKLARFLQERSNKKVMVTSCDIYRPAAIEQLHSLANDLEIEFFPSTTNDKPIDIALNAVNAAKKAYIEVVIVDTAGRLHVNEDMMQEIKDIHSSINPHETLFVVDGMTGQDAAITTKAFGSALPLTGTIVTKLDGDTRGGAVLSIKKITDKPIKFIGTGEKTDALEPFHPERMASRILGMGDVLSFIEELERKVDQDKAKKIANKIAKGKGFDLEDFREQLIQMNNMGGLTSIMDKLPGLGQIPEEAKAQVNDKATNQMLAVINSMTLKERRNPELMVRGSRKRRVANGSGTDIQVVNRLLKQFKQMQKMMKKFGKGGKMASLLGGLGQSNVQF